MDREDALTKLHSDVPSERLAAARFLQFWALPGDIPALRQAIGVESVSWIRRSIASGLARLGDRSEQEIDLDDYLQDSGELSTEAASIARARMARMLVHELEPVVGTMQYYASREIENFESSRTAAQIDRLRSLLRALDTLGRVVSTPRMHKFDLVALVSRLVESERVAGATYIHLVSPSTVQVVSDPALIEIAVANALRNGVEAVSSCGQPRVDVVLDRTDREFWVAVRDNGPGLPGGSSERLFEPGTSTKDGHLGMGLTLAVESATTLKGRLALSSTSRGTEFDLRIPLAGES